MSGESSSSLVGYAAGLRGADLSKWLENKLGPSDDLWCSRNICAHLSQEVLANCQNCFVDLQTSIKLKLLLSFIHVGRRNLEQWREEVEDIVNLASQDADDWVQTVAELLRDFPTTNAINLVSGMEGNSSGGHFARALVELKESLSQVPKESQLLPMESTFMNRPALQATFGLLPPQVKHFSLKRKSKAAALRSDLLLKASDAASHVKNKGCGMSSVVPIRPRAMAKVNNTAPLKGLPQNVIKNNSQFTSSRSSVMRPTAPKREGGIKLIELDDVPVLLKNRRKSAKAAESAKEKDKKITAEEDFSENAADKADIDTVINDVVTTSAAANEEAMPTESQQQSGGKRRRSKVESSPKAKRSRGRKVETPEPPEEVDLTTTADVQQQSATVQQLPMIIPISAVRPELRMAMETAQSVLAKSEIDAKERISVIIKPSEAQGHPNNSTPDLRREPQSSGIANLPGTQPYFMAPVATQQQLSSSSAYQPPMMPQSSAAFFSPFPTGQQLPTAACKPMLSLSKEVMITAQEMFKTANKLSRPEKALILGFMAGSRDNPCPHMGEVLTVRLSERLELMGIVGANPADPQHHQSVVVEDFFQMNYATGEWKKLSKSRQLKPGEQLQLSNPVGT